MLVPHGEDSVSARLAGLIDRAVRQRIEVKENDGLLYLEPRLMPPFRACFTTRRGGRSIGPFASLNLDPRSGDEPMSVSRNRELVGRLVWDTPSDSADHVLITPMQVHGLRVSGAAEYAGAEPLGPCDGLTLHPVLDRNVAALLLFADCVPIVLAGEVDMAVVHGGWKGIVGGVVGEAGRAMIGPPGFAVIGPSIGPCCFEVGDDVAAIFGARYGQSVVLRNEDGTGFPHVDLWKATTEELLGLGVPGEQIVNPRICTACNSEFFYSYRREGPVTGRHGCVAWAAAA